MINAKGELNNFQSMMEMDWTDSQTSSFSIINPIQTEQNFLFFNVLDLSQFTSASKYPLTNLNAETKEI